MLLTGSFLVSPTQAVDNSAPTTEVAINLDNLYEQPVKTLELPMVKKPDLVLPDILIKIRYCESKDDYTAQNSRSTASGAFQFIDGTWNNYGGYAKAKLAPAFIQDEYAFLTYQKEGTKPWNASKHCWQPKARTASNLTVSSSIYHIEKNVYAYDCVVYLRKGMGIAVPQNAYAYRIAVATKTASAGRIIVTYEGRSGHFGYVLKVENGLVYIQDGNYRSGYMTRRTIPADSRLIKGYL